VINPISTGVSYPVSRPPTAAPVPAPPLDQTPLLPLADPAAAGTSSAQPNLGMFGGDLESVDPQIAAALSALGAPDTASGGSDMPGPLDAAMTTPNVSLAQSALASYGTAGRDTLPGDAAADAGGVDFFA